MLHDEAILSNFYDMLLFVLFMKNKNDECSDEPY